MKIDGYAFTQTLIKYSGAWRLYLNTPMRKAAKKEVGDTAIFEVVYDPVSRAIAMHPKLKKAIAASKAAKNVFDGLRPSLQAEMVRYISHLKTEEKIIANVSKAINFLLGKEKFAGREKP